MITIKQIKYPYSLSYFRGSKYYPCPNCGKRRFKPYCTPDGKPVNAAMYGRCQREVKCGYHLPPNSNKMKRYVSDYVPLQNFYLPDFYVTKYLNNVHFSTLLTFFNKRKINFTPIFQEYKVGGTYTGKTVFFQYDGSKWRVGKQMEYVNGHRSGHFWWLHKDKALGYDEKKHCLSMCFFGTHLINKYPDKQIAIVESEKTALFCAGVFPQFVWLATGGRTMLNTQHLHKLHKREVYLFPDTDSIDYWSSKIAPFSNCKVIDCSFLNKINKKGADLCDFLLDFDIDTKRKTYDFINSIGMVKI